MASVLRAYKCVPPSLDHQALLLTTLPKSSFLQRRPMLAQCVTAGVLFGTGDVIAQQAIEKRGWAKHDVR